MENVLYFLICILATTLGAISGIGGGVIIKPVMDALGGMEVSAISFLSGCTVLSMSVVSLLRSRGGDAKINGRQGTFLALGSAAGGILGKQIFDLVKAGFSSGAAVTMVQNAVMILLTAGVFVYTLCKGRIKTLGLQNWGLCVAIGLVLGLLGSFLGIGGGPINLVVLSFFFSMDSKTAALNSIYIILFSQSASLVSTFAAGKVPGFSPVTLVCMAAGGVLGGFLGRSVSKGLNNRQVDKLFLGMLAAIIGISIYNFGKSLALL